jgi:hypothetical protein
MRAGPDFSSVWSCEDLIRRRPKAKPRIQARIKSSTPLGLPHVAQNLRLTEEIRPMCRSGGRLNRQPAAVFERMVVSIMENSNARVLSGD